MEWRYRFIANSGEMFEDELPILIPIGSFAFFNGRKYKIIRYQVSAPGLGEFLVVGLEVECDIDITQICRDLKLETILKQHSTFNI